MIKKLKTVLNKLKKEATKRETSPIQILKRAVDIRIHQGMYLDEAIMIGILDPKVPIETARNYIGRDYFVKHIREINRQGSGLLADKTVFYQNFISKGIKTPTCYAFYSPQESVTANNQVLKTEEDWLNLITNDLPENILIKPSLSEFGHGIKVYKKENNKFSNNNESLSYQDFYHNIVTKQEFGKCVIQERLRNHDMIDDLTKSDALQCIRMIVFENGKGKTEFYTAWFKISVGKGITDNFLQGTTGNLLAMLNPETGEIIKVYRAHPLGGIIADVDTHYVTGKQLVGIKMPLWDEVKRIAQQASQAVLPVKAVGWDIAITNDGPIIIEGNSEFAAMGKEGPYFHNDDLTSLINAVA